MENPTSFPNFAGKHAHDALVTPEEYLRYLRQQNRIPDLSVPRGVILCYQEWLLERIAQHEAVEPIRELPGHFHRLSTTDGALGLCSVSIGAPAATAVLEELIAFGAQKFVSIGTAGGLQSSLRIGDLVVCDGAIRDEGVSHHYLQPAKYAFSSEVLTDVFVQQVMITGPAAVIGSTWTIDAPYRETVEEARYYQQEGVLTVEMEAAALFAVAAYRSVDVAAGFVISDSLADLAWNPQFDDDAVRSGLDRLYAAGRATLLLALASN